ncbi:MAG: hypothetical protein CMM93_00105 [Rickettsiales bacterium]|nr:hypothetical protein [Rickettsiales bacterium]
MADMFRVDRHVAERMKKLREDAKMSQETLAQRLNTSLEMFKEYEEGNRRIGAGMLYELTQIFGVEPTYFFEDLPDLDL